jgi:hypothetical protein
VRLQHWLQQLQVVLPSLLDRTPVLLQVRIVVLQEQLQQLWQRLCGEELLCRS